MLISYIFHYRKFKKDVLMNLKKYTILAATSVALLVGCGDDSSSSSAESNIGLPDTPSFSVSTCQTVTDPSLSTQLESAKADISEILKAIGDTEWERAQAMSAGNKKIFKDVLDKFPGNCEAQLGYTVSIITDLVNNREVKGFIDSVTNKQKFADLDVEDFNKYLINADGTKMSEQLQKAVASAIPSVDSAVIFMKNIVADENFVCNYTYEDRTYELDRGEFAPALAALYVAKSILTMAASLNIDFSYKGNYEWMNDVNKNIDQDSISNESKSHIENLLSKSSSFTTVYDNWKQAYKNIPNLLDSAISYVQIGLQYGIDESKKGYESQKNDLYIVGDDEMSDVSASDFQKAIDSLEYYRKTLTTGVEITLPAGSKVTVNLGKFFEITDGWQDYFPYHKVNDVSTWLIPEEGNYVWTEDLTYRSYSNRYAEHLIERIYKKQIKDIDYIWADIDYWNADTLVLKVEVDPKNEHYYYDFFNITIDNCTLSFTKTEPKYSYYTTSEDAPIKALAPITLGPEFCKVENGVPMFATSINHPEENYVTFTDASGKKTISWQSLQTGHIVNDHVEDYKIDDLKNLIIFPDITFGGVLPGMTVEKFWEMIKTESRDDDEGEAPYYYEDEWDY